MMPNPNSLSAEGAAHNTGTKERLAHVCASNGLSLAWELYPAELIEAAETAGTRRRRLAALLVQLEAEAPQARVLEPEPLP
jgi:hypothetical protein